MNKILIPFCLVASSIFAYEGFWGAPGEESLSILNQNLDAIYMATSGAGVSDDFLQQEQLATPQPQEYVELSVRPGLQEEIYTSLWWVLPVDAFQLSSHLKIYDRGNVNRYDVQGTELSGDDRPITISYGQGAAYRFSSKQMISSRLGLAYEHLSHSQLTRTSGAYFLDLGWVSYEQNFGYGLLIKNLGHEFISSREKDESPRLLNTTIQAGWHFRMIKFPRLKWNFDYVAAAYLQPSLLASLDFQMNSHLQGFISTRLSHELQVNILRTLRSQERRTQKDVQSLFGTGAKLAWESWICEVGLAYTPLITQMDMAISIGKNW